MNWRSLSPWILGEFSLRRLIVSAILIYGILCLYIYFTADSKIFLPPPSSYRDTPNILKVQTADQVILSALYLPNPEASHTILYSHGNAEDLGNLPPILELIRQEGYSVFAYDYRGYGTSTGRPSETGTYQDMDAVMGYLQTELGIPPEQVIPYGRSVGGGPSTYAATQYPVAGLVLESTFTSIFRVVVPIPILPFDKFPNLRRIHQLKAPLLVIHGTQDRTIPFHHGQELFTAASVPKQSFWVEGADHNDLIWVAGDRYPGALQNFAAFLNRES
jgi:fermentation-respiration switch protein FrsA (DUF1100 family)